MRKYYAPFVASVLLAMMLSWGFLFEVKAGAWTPSSINARLADGWSSLIVRVKHHKHCTKVFTCDYFAPATSCSAPPCCKKGHWEKNCEEESKSGESVPTNPTPESAPTNPSPETNPCYPVCQAKCANTRSNQTPEQCINDCLQITRC